MRLGARWLETYIICQLLLVAAWACVRFLRVGRSPGRTLGLARTALLGAVLIPVLVRLAEPPPGALLPALASLDRMPRLDLTNIAMAPRDADLPAGGAQGPRWRGVDPLRVAWTIVLLGGVIHLSRTGRDLVRIRRFLRRTVALRSVGSVHVVVSAECRVPFSVALPGKAYVVLPTHLLASAAHVRMAIVHEVQHHRQGDCRTAYLLELLRAVFFWNPAIHLWRSTLGELQELSCDEALIARRGFAPFDYGRCLLAVAQAASAPTASSRHRFACVVGMAREGGTPVSFLRRRVLMLSRYRSAPRPTAAGVLAAALLLTAPLAVALAGQGSLTARDAASLDLSQLDPRLQRIAEAEVKEALARFKAKSVAVVAARPQTGRVVAFAEAHADRKQTSWASRVFAPGSTTKPFVVAAALESGAVTVEQVLDCQQPYAVGGRTFNNHDPNVTRVSTTDVIVQSVNVCTIKMAQAAGRERVRHTLRHFGLDWKTEGSSGEGQQLSADDADALLGVTLPANLAGMVRAYSTLANHGRSPASTSDRAISEKTADAMVRMLVAAVDHGTGRGAALPNVAVAGKTGTTRLDAKANDPRGPLMAMFGGFAPAEAPRLVAFVVVEGGVQGQEQAGGGTAAAPTFRELMARSLGALDHAAR